MFIRAVWRIRRAVDIPQAMRELDVPSSRKDDVLGLCGPEFSQMTKGVFGRP